MTNGGGQRAAAGGVGSEYSHHNDLVRFNGGTSAIIHPCGLSHLQAHMVRDRRAQPT